MKKILIAFAAIAVAFALVSCGTTGGTTGSTGPIMAKTYPPQVLEHKGTWIGMTELPPWVSAAISGPMAVEKLPDYKDKYVVVVETDAADKTVAERLLEKQDAATKLSAYLSTRVEDKFASAEVGDKEKMSTYFERVVKNVSEATFSGYEMKNSWWVYLQTFTPEGKPDARVYRVIQIWTIDKAILQKQLDKILDNVEAEVAKTPEEKRAMDLVQSTFYDGF